jgi:uncharacterized protein (TIGR01777 family)
MMSLCLFILKSIYLSLTLQELQVNMKEFKLKKRVTHMKILITGATGFVGSVIVQELLASGDEVVVLTRSMSNAALTLGSRVKYFYWGDYRTAPPAEAFAGVDGVINLMGETISKRWDAKAKKEIYDSRIVATRSLVEGMRGLAQKPKAFVSASAIGFYGNRGAEELDESSAAGSDFLAKVCKDWEKEANQARDLGIRLAIIRIGVVLGRKGGALAKMLPIFRMGVGGKVGSGKQYMSWIHVKDLAGMFIEAVKNPLVDGVLNGTAEAPATNAEFTKVLGRAIGRPTLFPAPAAAMKLMFGEMSTLILDGQKVLPKQFLKRRYHYKYPTLEKALRETAY